MKKKIPAILTLLALLVILAAINMIGAISLSGANIDVTAEKLFTLDDGSRNIAASLEDPVTIRFFFSRTALSEHPGLRQYGQRILEVLKSYRAASNGKITIEVIDPRPDTEEEEAAMRYDLQGVSIDQFGELVYIGLVIRDESGRESVLRFLDPEKVRFLEYDISKALYALAHPERKKIGVISSLPVMGTPPPPARNPMMQQQGSEPWFIIQQMKSTFDVVEVPPQSKFIPDDLDLLMIIHPKNLSDSLRYAVDQYVLSGRNAIVFVDPLSEYDQRMQQQMAGGNMQAMLSAQVDSDIPELFKAWGLKLVRGEAGNSMTGEFGQNLVVAADPTIAAKRPTPQGGLVDDLSTIVLAPSEMNQQQIITSDLPHTVMVTAGVLQTIPIDTNIKTEILLSTTDQAGMLDSLIMKFAQSTEDIADQFKKSGKELALAMKVSGTFRSAFNGNIPEGIETDSHIDESKSPATIIVIADSDIISDNYAYEIQNFFGTRIASPANGNSILAFNAAENLTGSQDLINLRSRGMKTRTFQVVEKINREAQAQYREALQSLEAEQRRLADELNQLERSSTDAGTFNTALAQKRKELLAKQASTQKQLRELRLRTREDVEKLGMLVKFINIALMPFIVVLIGIVVSLLRASRRRRARANPA